MLLQSIVLLAAFVAGLVMIMARRLRLVSVVAGVVVTVSALLLAFCRDTYLPFLGSAAIPPSLLKDEHAPRNANIEATIAVDAPDGTRVLYWGARPSKELSPDPWAAYADWSNAGIAVVKGGKATLRMECPGKYRVPIQGELERHVHFRVSGAKGMMGPVKTEPVVC
jgi:hypothetical protein